jgi:cytochrome c2
LPKLRRARLIGANLPFVTSLGLIALLSACGGAPEATNNTAAADNAVNAAVNAVENATANETTPVNTTNTVAPTPTPTPSATPTPVAAATPEPKIEAPASGDAANGAKLFAQCKICHAVEPGKNGLGPSLHGVVGRKSATLAGFNYSPAMKASGLTWTDAELNDYLRGPMKAVPGTKMAFAGIANDKNRADVIAYLDTLK